MNIQAVRAFRHIWWPISRELNQKEEYAASYETQYGRIVEIVAARFGIGEHDLEVDIQCDIYNNMDRYLESKQGE